MKIDTLRLLIRGYKAIVAAFERELEAEIQKAGEKHEIEEVNQRSD